MKNMKKAIALCLALLLCLTFPVGVSAAEVGDATIDFSKTGSLTLYKIDLTNAEKDGIWDSSYVSTGVYDQDVYDTLIGATRAGDTDNSSDLGNGEKSYGYAIPGVEFTILKIADIVQFTESTNDGSTSNHVEVLYGIDKVKGAEFLKTIGLENGTGRYENADKTDKLDASKFYYQSDVLINALNATLEANATVVKNAMEAYVKANGGISMPLTDSYGKTSVSSLELGLYLCCETLVPEYVTTTCNPFLLSVPMTSVSGSNATDGGTRWIYDVVCFPKNLTGIPTLEKQLKENVNDTGKNQGTQELTDGYAHTGTASAGDVIDYVITSTLPSITSSSTYLKEYSFIDTLSKGISYLKGDVVLEFYTDAACTKRVAKWTEADGKFTVNYSTTDAGESVMRIEMTAAGLNEINTSKTVYTAADMVNSGYSDCTVKITYQAQMNSDDSVVFGDAGNPNEVVLVWRRTSTNDYDTLVDDAHLFTYGVELTKKFSDGQGNFDNVEFILHNDTDGYFVIAELNADDGFYYVTGHTTNESEATHLIPVKQEDGTGKVFIKGLEDDEYTATEVRTDDGYTLLKDDIKIIISNVETVDICDIYESDILGLIQNDPRYATIINDTGDLKNMPQKHLEHHLL
ncbi:MAG: SpaH/EbpB family LPXTG-anchored major pilin, partial [Oscillospiraceae bacterium]|nr:SpaH/EbpB family LPXTG-anchored major pilin [Oscillospiraceae bacterium]